MRVDLDRQLQFPSEITASLLQPDNVLWLISAKTVIMAELMIPWEKGMETAFERKKEKYRELSAACTEAMWNKIISTFLEDSLNHLVKADKGRGGGA